jgi:membrane protein YqaA with SNARE-associated domain
MDLIQGLWDFLNSVQNDVFVYSAFLFLYSIASAIILPIPVELALFISPATPFILKALLLGAGKAVGSVAIFYIGFELEGPVRRWSDRFKFFKKFVDFCEWFVAKLGYVGLFILLIIPLMSDTVVLYVFSLFNKEGRVLQMKWFALVNLLAGITRAMIVYAIVIGLGWNIL